MSDNRQVDLSTFDNQWYKPGGLILRVLWYVISILFFQKGWIALTNVKVLLLKCFGAKIGKNVVIKPHVKIKYPWKLSIGDNSWIGEQVWIDNLGEVEIGENVCISQGAFLLCGNHDYRSDSFDLMVSNIKIENGAWVGAKSIVCPGIEVRTHAVLAVGSVATSNLEAYTIYQGNPAVKRRERIITQ